MRFSVPNEVDQLAECLDRFVMLVGRERWFARAGQLDAEQRKSPWLWKIVADYHWLEMAISYQADVFAKEARLVPELIDVPAMAALNYAAVTVGVHSRLSAYGRQVLEGRLRDALKAETGFAPLYLELDLARRLMDCGYDVQFPDMEGIAQYDLMFSRGKFVGEVECKSLSADAGRQIHRKDFYRFMEAIAPALTTKMDPQRHEALVITLDGRLPSNIGRQEKLLQVMRSILRGGEPFVAEGDGFRVDRMINPEFLAGASTDDTKSLYEACKVALGQNVHIAGGLAEGGGRVVVMRSQRDDDTSKPLLDAMRKAATQLSGQRPGFIAVQEHGMDVEELMLPHVHRRSTVLSYALFGHYGATHVNAVYVTGFGAFDVHDGRLRTPCFTVANPEPAFAIKGMDLGRLLRFHLGVKPMSAFSDVKGASVNDTDGCPV